jgi:hypothetical protein
MTARKNMTNGPTIQFCVSDKLSNLRFLNTKGIFSYFTFANGGYIIRIRPMAIGIFVVPVLNEFQKPEIPGAMYPIITPENMIMNIQRVK